MNLVEELLKIGQGMNAEVKEKKGVYKLTSVIAERKAFLSKKKLTYVVKFRVDDANKLVKFTETLIDSGSGLGAGSSMGDVSSTPGFGFKTETYNTMSGAREGNIEELSNLFGAKFTYNFDYKKIRQEFEAKAKEAGYGFKYQITSLGL